MPVQSQELLNCSPATREAAKSALFAHVVSRYGRARMKAFGSSMLPAIWPGDTLVVERRPLSELSPGDVAVYARFGRLFAHRVVRRTSQPDALLITRGDAMAQEDPPVLQDELIGCVIAVVPGRRLLYRLRRALFQVKSALAWFRRGAAVSL